jgi:hypothetical protein
VRWLCCCWLWRLAGLGLPQPPPIKCVVFHVRRIAKAELLAYQLMEECCAATSVAGVREVIEQCVRYAEEGASVCLTVCLTTTEFTASDWSRLCC